MKLSELIECVKEEGLTKGKTQFHCKNCSVYFMRWPSLKSKFCSRKCFSEYRDKNMLEDKCWSWKGDKVGYYGLHKWVERKLGKPRICTRCKTEKATKYEWANISHRYLRELSDWIRLCVQCHRDYDLNKITL